MSQEAKEAASVSNMQGSIPSHTREEPIGRAGMKLKFPEISNVVVETDFIMITIPHFLVI